MADEPDAPMLPPVNEDHSIPEHLPDSWTSWHFDADTNTDQELMTVKTLQEFMEAYSTIVDGCRMSNGSILSWFKTGISPFSSDPVYSVAGTWAYYIGKSDLNATELYWKNISMWCMRGGFPYYENVIGIEIQIKENINTIQLWAIKKENRIAVKSIGKHLLAVIQKCTGIVEQSLSGQ